VTTDVAKEERLAVRSSGAKESIIETQNEYKVLLGVICLSITRLITVCKHVQSIYAKGYHDEAISLSSMYDLLLEFCIESSLFVCRLPSSNEDRFSFEALLLGVGARGAWLCSACFGVELLSSSRISPCL
jgi:hypothetical protein